MLRGSTVTPLLRDGDATPSGAVDAAAGLEIVALGRTVVVAAALEGGDARAALLAVRAP